MKIISRLDRYPRTRTEARAIAAQWASEIMEDHGKECPGMEHRVDAAGNIEWIITEPRLEEIVPAVVLDDEWFDNPWGNAKPPPPPGPERHNAIGSCMSSYLAGIPKPMRDLDRGRSDLQCATGDALCYAPVIEAVRCMRQIEWLYTIVQERLSWRRAAEILRLGRVWAGELVLPVNDHGRDPKTGEPVNGWAWDLHPPKSAWEMLKEREAECRERYARHQTMENPPIMPRHW